MHKYPNYTRERLRQLGDRLRDKIYPEKRPIDVLLVSESVARISYDEAQKLKKFRPAKVGEQFGPLWATYWFRASTAVPAEWKGKRVDLLWGMHSESTLWVNGKTAQGLNWEPMSWDGITRPDAMLARKARGGEKLEFQVEMACNKLFGYDGNHTPFLRSISPYVLDFAEIAVFDEEAWNLYFDYIVLQTLESEHRNNLDRTWDGVLLSGLNDFANTYDPDNRSTWGKANKILKGLYGNHNGSTAHEVSAIGHAHIDSAWLWPLEETKRKCERTFSSQIAYMETYPDFKFACSQAVQYAWMKAKNPELYQRIKAKVKSGQFIPVGGTWVEPDCNIPSGESMARQFLYGQRFFEKEFGIRCKEFWNPDVFGYNGQLPQICNQSGVKRFLTQKLSWNHFNKPWHQSFIWEGIDGSEVVTHFPPNDNYNCMATVPELTDGARRYKDNDRSRHSMLLFGIGDGGGGPTKKMIETLHRVEDLQGVPRTKIRSSNEFFDLLEADCSDWVRMVGELYFEYHRGTYTTQAATKRGNRKCEFALHDAEFLAAAASRLAKKKYPAQQLEGLWKTILTNQFHDILPGSSIALVYDDAERDYAEVEKKAGELRDDAVTTLVGSSKPAKSIENLLVVNTAGFDRFEVVSAPDGKPVYVEAPSYGLGAVVECPDTVKLTRKGKRFVFENECLRATLGPDGSLVSLIEKMSGRETMAAPGNKMMLYVDTPTAYDAWDVDPFHMEQESECPGAHACKVVEEDPLRVAVEFERKIGLKSSMIQRVSLAAGAQRLEFHTEVDWHEDHKMLKVAFPVNVRAMNATYEMQFGNVERPTHFNTSFDLAQYEVPGHKWADMSEYGFGVALLSESKYGFSAHGNVMRMSLLRSAKHPDPEADMGRHNFVYAIMPHEDTWREADVVAESYLFNQPVVFASTAKKPVVESGYSFLGTDDPNIVIDTVKQAEDSDAIIVRMFECHGARGVAHIYCDFPFKSAHYCNFLEDEGAEVECEDGILTIPFESYKVISVKLK